MKGNNNEITETNWHGSKHKGAHGNDVSKACVDDGFVPQPQRNNISCAGV